jgi:hypothetical protein
VSIDRCTGQDRVKVIAHAHPSFATCHRYPPNAPEPVAITDYSKPISHTFPAHTSNLNLVSLFVYIKPEAQQELARIPSSSSSSSSIETFVYPPRPAVIPHQHHSSPSIPTSGSMAGGEEVVEGESSLKMERRRRRGASSRPSTAPSLGSSSGFGFSSPLVFFVIIRRHGLDNRDPSVWETEEDGIQLDRQRRDSGRLAARPESVGAGQRGASACPDHDQ